MQDFSANRLANAYIGRLTSDFTSASSTSLQAITGTLITVPVGTYAVRFCGIATAAFGGTGNKSFQITSGGGLVVTGASARFSCIRYSTTASVCSAWTGVDVNSTANNQATVTTIIEGSVVVTTGGTMNIGLTKATAADSVVIGSGSYFTATKVG